MRLPRPEPLRITSQPEAPRTTWGAHPRPRSLQCGCTALREHTVRMPLLIYHHLAPAPTVAATVLASTQSPPNHLPPEGTQQHLGGTSLTSIPSVWLHRPAGAHCPTSTAHLPPSSFRAPCGCHGSGGQPEPLRITSHPKAPRSTWGAHP